MELKLLNKEELSVLYRTDLSRDFPREERKPLRSMLALMEQGKCEPLIVTEGERQIGYAIVWRSADVRAVLLEYFGVQPELRDRGLGGKILDLLADHYGQIFCEAETPVYPDPALNELCRHRLGFYQRSGFRLLDYECALFGVRFNCLYRGQERDDRRVEAWHRGIYADWFSPAEMERFIQLPLKPGEAVHPIPEEAAEDEIIHQ